MAKKADGTEDNSPETVSDANTPATVPDTVTGEASTVFVTMVRDPDIHPAPHTAQVHPEEVHNYYSGGWTVKKDEAE